MMTVIRTEEILREVKKIEKDQEEAGRCINEIQRGEEAAYEEIRRFLVSIGSEFEAYHGDSELTNLAEEKYNLLLRAERDCDDFVRELSEERNTINSKCEADIEELKQEMEALEVL